MDILTQWTLRKRLEHVFNGALCCRDISCQPPERYAQRMRNFVEAAIRSTLEADYEARSRVGRQQWISSFVPVIKGALFGRDPDCWRTLSNTSPVQLRFMAQDRANAAWASWNLPAR